MKLSRILLPFAFLLLFLPTFSYAVAVPMVDNRVVVDNYPFNSIGPEDGLGGGNYALNHPIFIDIPYAIFDFGTTTHVTNATLSWDFLGLYGGSAPASITLYAGSDLDGIISVDDRFMGTAVDTHVYSGAESRNFDLTSIINNALLVSQYFAIRLEVDAAPGTLSGYHGGQFGTPTLNAVPLPAAVWLLGSGLLGLIGISRRKKAKVTA